MAAFIGILAGLSYLIIFFELSLEQYLPYNIFAQILVGIILADIFLVVSKNRLQAFIDLLPFAMISLLFINALSSLLLLASQASNPLFINPLALILYFALHLIIALILTIHIFKKWKLGFITLLILLFMAASLPIWSLLAKVQ